MDGDYKTLLRLFINICLIKKGPRDIPESTTLLQTTFIAYLLSGMVLLSSANSIGEATVQALIETVLLGVFTYFLVVFFAFPHRFNQSVTAIYGSGALITSISIPFVFWLEALSKNGEQAGIAGLVVFLIVFWGFIVMANIIRETIQKQLSICLLLTFCYVYASYRVIDFVYPITT
ncbi:MAG: hypothetical protein COB22_00145 [Cycloclasticus sp.]|nr:MAG: hypothetical protein COB22_00145 [Cycloclasticus sp.]